MSRDFAHPRSSKVPPRRPAFHVVPATWIHSTRTVDCVQLIVYCTLNRTAPIAHTHDSQSTQAAGAFVVCLCMKRMFSVARLPGPGFC